MLALTDFQLQIVMAAASGSSPEKRSLFLEHVAARLQLYGAKFTDAELDRAASYDERGVRPRRRLFFLIAATLMPSHNNEPDCHVKDADVPPPQPSSKTIIVSPGTVDLINRCPGDFKYSVGDFKLH